MSSVHLLRNEHNALHPSLSEVELVVSPSGKVGQNGLAIEQRFEELQDVLKDSDGLERVFFGV